MLIALATFFLISTGIEAREMKNCVDTDGRVYMLGQGYETNCTQLTCQEIGPKLEMVASPTSYCCWDNGQEYQVGQIVSTQQIERVKKCESVEGKATLTDETMSGKYCIYEKEMIPVGSRLPLTEMCSWITCEFITINQTKMPSLTIQKLKPPGVDCCLGGDGDMYREGVNRTLESGMDGVNKTLESGMEGVNRTLESGMEGVNRTLESGMDVTCYRGNWNAVRNNSNLGDVYSQISGKIIKRNPSLSNPTRLVIVWFNFIEGDGKEWAWKRIGGQSILETSGDFSLKMEMTNSELANNITIHQKVLQRWSEKLTLNQTEQFKNIKFAMGMIFGSYNEDPPNDLRGFFNEKGPNGEQAYSDMYAVFYRSGPIDVMTNSLSQSKGKDFSCHWWAQLPQGFSCGRGAAVDPTCGRGRFERYVPSDCSAITVKVSDKKCQKYYCNNCEGCYEEFGYCFDSETGLRELELQHPDLGNKEDCFTYVNWT